MQISDFNVNDVCSTYFKRKQLLNRFFHIQQTNKQFFAGKLNRILLNNILIEYSINIKYMWLVAKTQVEFISQKWQQGIGESCHSCKNKLVNNQVISLCKCYLFCHQQCFLRQFSPFLFDNQKYVCIRCLQEVKLAISYTHKWQCNKSPIFIISLVISALAILALIIMNSIGIFKQMFSIGIGFLIISLLLLVLAFAVIFALRKKYINLQLVRALDTHIHETPQTESQLKNPDKDYSNDLNTNGNSQKRIQFDIS